LRNSRALVAVSAYYFFLFGGVGVLWPNYGPFLTHLGVGPAEAAFIISINPAMGLFIPPLVGLLADARRAREWILRVMAVLAALGMALWALEPGTRVGIYAVALFYSAARAPISALADVSAFDLARRHGTSFGRLRLWGSVGFLLAAPLGGVLLEHGSPRLMIGVAALGVAAAAAATFFLPAAPMAREPGAYRAWRALVRDPEHRRYLAAVFLGYVGGGVLDGCFSLHLADLGHGGSFIGLAWSVGVISEVALMHWSGAIIARIGAARLLAGALAVAALRWTLVAVVEHPALLLALQPLHGITFGCTFVAAATLARDRAPAAAPASSQGLFTAVAAAGSLVGMNGGGQILAHAGGHAAFAAAAGCALAGTLVARGMRDRIHA
jgi:PPP family 3-phenylpropionic acid transporter